jgi:Secretion system C-terminal sorting domain
MKYLVLLLAFVFCGLAANAQQAGKSPNLSVFPNPATEFIAVQDNNDVVAHVAIFSLVGKKIREFEHQKGERYSVSDLPKGMYLVQLLDRSKDILTTQKIDKR